MPDKKQKTEEKPTYWQRLIYGKGTVAEPWATPEELWKDQEVKDIIDWNNELIAKKNKS